MNFLNSPKFVTRSLIGAVGLSAIAFLGFAESASALTVVKGSDYWKTKNGSFFNFNDVVGNVEFISRPLGQWTPPGSSEPLKDSKGVTLNLKTDTVVRRLDDITFNTDAQDGEYGVSNVEVVALSLKSKSPVRYKGSLFNIFIDLNTNKQSTGTININEDRTFFSDFTVNFLPSFHPVSKGAATLSCADVFGTAPCDNFSVDLHGRNGKWTRRITEKVIQTEGPSQVRGVVGDINANIHTNLSKTQTDFFVIGIVEHDAGGAGHHTVRTAPEPLTILGSATAMGFGTFFKRKLGKKRQQDKA
ncbi:PEP-CTERM sorting domain-containing protein [Aphanothece sacrum]|uniref:Uncharacterized protein n=1 Tax=Aphanothece sacrum FPU1 TaxID=1920663 RepID=A0A401IG60_APHSA|nr:PEP-CTERM sorting domain-containing protein [Aphanothece sacrum]GBF80272.1 hypothetical protein AsFPU1_1673 [Aphanothece sacrum FPU1]GBF83677.1 hypothetical protein AsFPU3_0720 [Aphanothece sacrum FPU3]